jgi:catechol 2,3-dioxygenase-like lactoylglutathione lyase family enzyme
MPAYLSEVVLETRDPQALAAFYGPLLGWSVVHADDDWLTLGEPGREPSSYARLAFQLAPGYEPPVWPHPASPMQAHLDLAVDDLDEGEAEVLALGGRRLDAEGDGFRVYADPEGHLFCLVLSPAVSPSDTDS